MGVFGTDAKKTTPEFIEGKERNERVEVGIRGVTMFMSVDETRHFARLLYQLARRVEKRMAEEGATS